MNAESGNKSSLFDTHLDNDFAEVLEQPQVPIIISARRARAFFKEGALVNYAILPLMSDEAAAGLPTVINDHDIEEYVLIPKAHVPHPKETTCIRIKGDSMYPLLREGYIVAVDHYQDGREGFESLKGKVVACRVEGGVTVKFFDYDEHHYILKPHNPKYDRIYIDIREENVIIGKIIWLFGKL
ncbi:MAG: S24 family peptidase [Candidatus Tectomicrobia bacterium]|nr:S24 family peptidase [Candidatus Tectomicrobia bacterium]